MCKNDSIKYLNKSKCGDAWRKRMAELIDGGEMLPGINTNFNFAKNTVEYSIA